LHRSPSIRHPVSDYVGEAGGALSPPGGRVAFESERREPTEPARRRTYIYIYRTARASHIYSWQHTVSEVVNALMTGAGLALQTMREWPFANCSRVAPGLVEMPRRYAASHRRQGSPRRRSCWAWWCGEAMTEGRTTDHHHLTMLSSDGETIAMQATHATTTACSA